MASAIVSPLPDCPTDACTFRDALSNFNGLQIVAHCPTATWPYLFPWGKREREEYRHAPTLPEKDRDVVVEPPVDYRIIVSHQTPTPVTNTCAVAVCRQGGTVKLQGSFSPRQHLIAKLLTPTPSMMIVAKNAACQITSLIT